MSHRPTHFLFRRLLPCLFGIGLLLDPGYAGLTSGEALAQGKNPKRAMKRFDKDGDGKVSRDEWKKSPDVFKSFDTDDDGYLTFKELKAGLSGGGKKKSAGQEGGEQKAAGLEGKVKISRKELDKITLAAFTGKFRKREHEVARGLLESELIPVYPDNAFCPKIDHIYGEPWQGPVPDKWHTGADIPAGWNEPIYAMADGEVVAMFTGEKGFRGLQVILRHPPEATGLDGWLYTLYSHFSAMPKVEIGQRMRMGEYLGPNGKTGVPGKKRSPHLHLSIYFSKSPKYAVTKGLVIPYEGHYIDPVALFRGGMPIDTHAMRALPESERKVKIAYKLKKEGGIVPPNAKIIWPYACNPD